MLLKIKEAPKPEKTHHFHRTSDLTGRHLLSRICETPQHFHNSRNTPFTFNPKTDF